MAAFWGVEPDLKVESLLPLSRNTPTHDAKGGVAVPLNMECNSFREVSTTRALN